MKLGPGFKSIIVMGLILGLAVWFRTYRMVDHFGLAFDQDLAAWIVRNIVVNKHLRLIGQLTSTDGIFIGPLYYYLQIPFFLLLKMDIKAILLLPIVLGLITTFSYYWILKRIFSEQVGKLGAFLHGTVLTLVLIDRWAVPTVTTTLWSVWYLWSLYLIANGKFKALFLSGVLIAAMWDVQLALLPLAILPVVAIWFSSKKPKILEIGWGGIGLFLGSLPLMLFEVRHGFSQTHALVDAFTGESGHGQVGWVKLISVVNMVAKNIGQLFWPDTVNYQWLGVGLLVSMWLWVLKKKLLDYKLNRLILLWIGIMVVSFSLNNKTISEYYFHNLNVVYIVIGALFLGSLFSKSKLLGSIIAAGLLIVNLNGMINYPYNDTGYNEKTQVTRYIKQELLENNYPCMAISFITNPGEGVGYRYLFWKNGIKTTAISSDVPVYTIVMPWWFSPENVVVKYGKVGVIPPNEKTYNFSKCKEDLNTTADMFGFVN